MSRSTQIWVGADHRPSSFSITGFGIGKTELSMQWSLPDYSELMPSMGRSEMIRVSATDDDPGAQCFVEIWTRGLIQRQAIGYTSRNYDTSATGMAYFDDSYSNLQFYAPVLK
ncbi:MAG: hypothetical protein HZB26_03660 [Candidatus Hydrogenedentes bacterium]|nr:hypothetical protein [Candidatus Hydrogenedentota bacterium]